MIALRILMGLAALCVATLVVLGIAALVMKFGVLAALVIPLIILCYLLGSLLIPE